MCQYTYTQYVDIESNRQTLRITHAQMYVPAHIHVFINTGHAHIHIHAGMYTHTIQGYG